MVRAEYHIGYQRPNEYTQVQRLIKSIDLTYIRIVTAITTILGDTVKRGKSEQAADFLLLPVVGSEALIIRTHERKVRVDGFTPALGSNAVDVVDTAVAYECEFAGEVLIMVIRNKLQLKEMKHNLLSQFFMRLAGLEVN